MYNLLPQLLVVAGRLIFVELPKRRQAAASRSGNAIAPTPPADPRRPPESALYGTNPSYMAIGLMAKLAKTDGVVTKEKVRAAEGVFAELGAVGEFRQRAITIFQGAKDGPLRYMDVLEMFKRQTSASDTVRGDLIFMLLRVAHASSNGVPSYQAEHLVGTACTALGLDYQQCLHAFHAWRQSRNAPVHAEADRIKLAYEILGCMPTDNDEHLRHRYRQLARDFHPDTIAGKGLSPEFTRFAEEKFKQIQAAYELLVEQRR